MTVKTPVRAAPPLPWEDGADAAPTPRVAWLLALLLAVLAAAGIVFPRLGLALVALFVGGLLARWVLTRPVNGLVLALLVFPVYPLFRGVVQLWGVPVPLTVAGMWPELILTAMFLGIVVGAIQRRERLRLYWDDAPVVFLLLGGLYAVLTSLAQRQVVAAVYGIHYSLSALLFYFAMRWARPTRADIARVMKTLLVAYIALALLSLADYVVRTNTGVRLASILRPSISGEWDPALFWSTYPRMQSLLFDENVWGSLSALVSLFCLSSLVVLRPVGRWALLTRLLFLLSTACVLASMSRGSLACWVVGLFVLLLFQGRHRFRVLLACLFLACLIGTGVYVLREDRRVGAAMKRIDSLTDTRSRMAYDRVDGWKQAWDAFQLAPSGTGIGTQGQAAVYHGGGGVVTDGQYLRVLAEQGVPGLIALLAGLTGLIWVLFRHLPRTDGLVRGVGLTAVAYLCGLCAQSVGSNALDFYYTPPVLWSLLGLFMARRLDVAADMPARPEATR